MEPFPTIQKVVLQNDGIHCVNTEISPNFLVWKLCLSIKFLLQEIRWNFGILHRDIYTELSSNKSLKSAPRIKTDTSLSQS